MVRVKIYANGKDLKEAYSNIYGRLDNPRAWYIWDYNTIYLNAEDMSMEIVSHEISHAVIDHYLVVRPPKETAEILARYVGDKFKHR